MGFFNRLIGKGDESVVVNRFEMMGPHGVTPAISFGQSLVIGRDPKHGDAQYVVNAGNHKDAQNWVSDNQDPRDLLSGECLEVTLTPEGKIRARALSREMRCYAFAEDVGVYPDSDNILSLAFGLNIPEEDWARLGNNPQFLIENPILDEESSRIGGPRLIVSTASDGGNVRKFSVVLSDASKAY